MFKKLNLKTKLIMIIIGLLFTYGIATLLISRQLIKTAIYKEKQEQTTQIVTIALGILNYHHQLELKGILSKTEAQEKAKSVIRSMLYGKNGKDYVFIEDYSLHLLVHPIRPELEGKDRSNEKDVNGLYYNKAISDICTKNGSGFVYYKNQYYNEKNRIEQKLTYAAQFAPWEWLVCTGIYLNDVEETIGNIQKIFILTSLIAIVIAVLISIFFAASLIRPLIQTTNILKDIADGEGDLTKRLAVKGQDEIAELSLNFNKFVDKTQEIIKKIGYHTSTLSSASEELSATSTQIASNTEELNAQAVTVAAGTEQANNNINNISSSAEEMSAQVNNVATSIEEMNASLHEVNISCQNEAKIVANANAEANSTLEIVSKLGQAAKSIGGVVDVINDIAEQTNLLALNASIEAATAGDAGKGFTVVANEVKELAKQTALATQKISEQIETIQANTDGAVNAIQSITNTIDQVNTISQSILHSVEEQSSTINEIAQNISGASVCAKEVAHNVTQSATGLKEISSTLSGVNVALTDTSKGVTQINQSAVELSKLSSGLEAIVKQFKV